MLVVPLVAHSVGSFPTDYLRQMSSFQASRFCAAPPAARSRAQETIAAVLYYIYVVVLDSVFFIENSEREQLFPLALCSLESAALHNPSKAVYMLRSTVGPTHWGPEVNTLVDNYRNIFFNTINADRWVLETPVASLWNTNKIEKSRYSLSHTR